MTKDVLRSGIIVCVIMLICAGLTIGQGMPVSQDNATAPPITQASRYTYLIPQAAHVQGDKGSNWRTDVVVHNGGQFEAEVRFYFLKEDTDNTQAEGIKVTLRTDTSLKLADIVRTKLGHEKAAGAILIGWDQPLVITSRTYNDDPKGTFGQYVEGYPIEKAITTNEEVRLIGLAENATRRTNIGFANATEKTLDILVAMYKADGTKLGEKTYQVLPYGFSRKDKIIRLEFGAGDVDDAFAVISSSTPDAKYFTYASVTDNLSNDPVCIVPVGRDALVQPDGESSAQGRNVSLQRAETVDLGESQKKWSQIEKPAHERIGDQWESIGPWGGNVGVLAIDPTNPQIMYAGAKYWTWGGQSIYKTTNGGLSWIGVNTGSQLDVRAITIDPTNTQRVYVGTSGRLIQTADGGVSWATVILGRSITTLAIDPINPKNIYAGSSYEGVFKTTDGGSSWTAVNTGLPCCNNVRVITIDPSNPQRVYLGTSGGLFQTANGGLSWAAASLNLPVMTLTIDPINPKNIFAGSYDDGVFKTTDGGLSWVAVNSGLSKPFTTSILVIDPYTPQTIYLGTRFYGVFKSTNGGGFWTAVNDGLLRLELETLAIDPIHPENIYAGSSYDGVFKTANGGSSWTAINTGLAKLHAETFAIDPVNSQTIYAVAVARFHNYGFFKTTNGGLSWFAIGGPSPQSISTLAIDPTSPQTVYAGTWGGGVFKSTNGGSSWSAENTGLSSLKIYAIAIDPTNPQCVYAGSDEDGIFKTQNGGSSWFAIGPSHKFIPALAVDPTNSQILYAGTAGEGIFKTSNGGKSWTKVNKGLSNLNVVCIAIDPINPKNIYAGTYHNGVFKTTNGGSSWTAINVGFSGDFEYAVYALAIDPTNPQGVFVGTRYGVFRSTNAGVSWSRDSSGQANDGISALTIDTTAPHNIYAATDDGIYKRSFSTPCSYMLNSRSASFPRLGGSGIFAVTTSTVCPWTAVSNAAWIVVGKSGTNPDVVTYSVSVNSTGNNRSGTLSIADQTFTVTQSSICGAPYTPSLTAPATASNGLSYSLSWTDNSTIDTYELQVGTTSDFTDASTRIVHGLTATLSHLAMTSAVFFTRIRAIDDCDGQAYISPWSNPMQTVISPESALVLPAAAHVSGLVGTNWRTDLEVHNPNQTQSSFVIALFGKDQNNTTPLMKSYSLGSYQSVRYFDVLHTLFKYSGSATLCVIPNEGKVMATSRTYNLLESGNSLGLPEGATFGQFIPGQLDTEAIQFGQIGRLIQLSQSIDEAGGFRTNIGITSVVAIPISIEIRLYKGDGTYLATKTVDLVPFGYKQINTIFANVIGSTMDDGYAEIKTLTPGGRFFAYASVTDNRSGDPIYIPAVVR